MTPAELTPRLLQELIRYDPETGKMYWKHRHERFFGDAAGAFLWNIDNAGKEIFKSSVGDSYKTQSIMGVDLVGHRVAWAIHYGKWPEGDIDHINGVPRDIRISNLRDVGPTLNQRNKVMMGNNTSGHTGVQKTKHGTYRAVILNRHLGTFKTLEEAVAAREEAQTSTPGFTGRHGKRRIVNLGTWHLKQPRLERRAREKASRLYEAQEL